MEQICVKSTRLNNVVQKSNRWLKPLVYQFIYLLIVKRELTRPLENKT